MVPHNLLELLSNIAEKPIAALSPAIIPNLECLEAQSHTYCKDVGRLKEHSIAR